MSVILYDYTHVNSIYHGLAGDDDFVNFINNKRVSGGSYPSDLKTFGRLMWYLYVANGIAYSLQYQEEVQIFSKEVAADKYRPMAFEDAAAAYSSLLYNIVTNDGNYFLGEPWYTYCADIKDFLEPTIKKYYNRDF